MYGTEEYAKAIEELGKAGESMAVAFAHFREAIGAAFSAGVIRQIKRCLFRQIKTGLSEHLTMG